MQICTSTPAQFQCSHSGVWDPGNEATYFPDSLVLVAHTSCMGMRLHIHEQSMNHIDITLKNRAIVTTCNHPLHKTRIYQDWKMHGAL